MRTATVTVLPFPSQEAARHGQDSRARVRLEPTRRGRMLLTASAFLLGLLVAAAVLLLVDLPALAGTEGQQPVTITVEAGDTLWGYAEEHAPTGMSTQEYVAEVRAHNHLTTPRVTAGQEIELPAVEGATR
jgi:hypothetical protein